MLKVLKFFIILLTLSSCAGYRYQEKANPFSVYGIKSIRIPMFFNHTNLSNASHAFTKEFYNLLSELKGLKIQGGSGNADATMIGILSSKRRLNNSMGNSGFRGAKSVAKNSIGSNREDFYIPSATRVSLELRIFVIKNPTKQEIDLLSSSLGEQVPLSSKVIFNESMELSANFNREYFDEDKGKVHATLNRGALKNTIENMAVNASNNFRNMILYAF